MRDASHGRHAPAVQREVGNARSLHSSSYTCSHSARTSTRTSHRAGRAVRCSNIGVPWAGSSPEPPVERCNSPGFQRSGTGMWFDYGGHHEDWCVARQHPDRREACPPQPPAIAGLCRRGDARARGRHRRQHRHLQRDRRHARAGHPLRRTPSGWSISSATPSGATWLERRGASYPDFLDWRAQPTRCRGSRGVRYAADVAGRGRRTRAHRHRVRVGVVLLAARRARPRSAAPSATKKTWRSRRRSSS